MKNLYDTNDPIPEEEKVIQPETPDSTINSDDSYVINCNGFEIKELTQHYMFGIDLIDQKGNPFPNSLIASYINGAISWAEQLFDICLTEQEISDECHDYERNDYMNWGFIQLWKRPVKQVKSLKLMYGSQPSFEVPVEWLKIDKMGGKVQMFPSQGSANNLIINQSGVIFGLNQRWGYAPQMWSVDYVAGMSDGEIPENLKVLIYKKAAMDVFTVWGDLILGAGIASQSISIDGLSQSIGTTQSAQFGGASARVKQYSDDINDMIPIIRSAFSSPRMVVL